MTVHRKLWLHVGLPKTATTAVQAWMRENAEDLLSTGVLYPPLLGASNDKHDFLVRDLLYAPDLTQLRRLLEQTSASTLLLSDEGLTNHLEDFDDLALAQFRALTPTWEVGIILVTRESSSWVHSYHKQCVLNPKNGASPLWGTSMTSSETATHPRVSRLLNTPQLILDLQSSFGASDIRTFQFEVPGWFDSFLGVLGAEGLVPAKLPPTNRSLPDWAVEVLRRVNDLTPEPYVRNGWREAVQSHLRTDHTVLANLPVSKWSPANDETYGILEQSLGTFPSHQRIAVGDFMRVLVQR